MLEQAFGDTLVLSPGSSGQFYFGNWVGGLFVYNLVQLGYVANISQY